MTHENRGEKHTKEFTFNLILSLEKYVLFNNEIN
jgi:hypothetical protein